MTMSKSMQRALSLQARLEKLAESTDEKIASKAVSDLTTLHISETEIEAREDRIMPLRTEIADLKRKLAAAEELLNPVTAERDALLTEASALREQVAKFATMETELADLKTNFDSKIAAMREELVAESQRHSWDAQRSENNAKETLREVRAQFDKAGLQTLLDYVKTLVEQFHIPEPAPSTLPPNISALIYTCWGYTPARATLMLSYHKTFPEPSAAFRQTLLQLLKTTLPMPSFAGAELPKPIENLADKISVLTAMAKRWDGVWPDIEQQFQRMQIERQTAFLREHHSQMAAREHEAAARGEGRTPIAAVQPASTLPASEHLVGCECPVCSPGLKRGTSLDEIPEIV